MHPYSDIVRIVDKGVHKNSGWWERGGGGGGHVTITAVGDLPLVVN